MFFFLKKFFKSKFKSKNIRNDDNSLIIAVKNGNKKTVNNLLKDGADINVVDSDGKSLIGIAFENNYHDIVELLLKYGADPNEYDKYRIRIILFYMQKKKYNILKYSIKNGSDINKRNLEGDSLVMLSCKQKNLNITKYLIEHGVDMNQVNNEGYSPLLYTCDRGYEDISEYLINSGADIEKRLIYPYRATENVKRIRNGDNPLILAVRNGNIKTVNILLKAGADITVKDNDGKSLIRIAFENNYHDIVELLICYGADPNDIKDLKDNERYTPLLIKYSKGYKNISDCLINNDADIEKIKKHHIASTEDVKDPEDVENSEFEEISDCETLIYSFDNLNDPNNSINNIDVNFKNNNNNLWMKTHCEWRSNDVFYRKHFWSKKKCIYYGRFEEENVKNSYCESVEFINVGCNELTYSSLKESNLNYFTTLLYEYYNRRFYVLFIDKDNKDENNDYINDKLYFSPEYRFIKLFEFPSQFYFTNQQISEFPQVRIKLYNKIDKIIQTINLNMSVIDGMDVVYNEYSIFYNTDKFKDMSNRNIFKNKTYSIKLATIDLIDYINPIFF